MLSDLLILAAVITVFATLGYKYGIVAALMAHCPTQQTGGWFYSWRPSTIRKFWNSKVWSNE